MRRSTDYFRFTLALLLLLPLPALALPTINCHCFTDRAFEPARPAAADPYFLASAQNSFFAIVFSTDKKSVVVKKQLGASADDLWVAYWIAANSATAPEKLLQAKDSKANWQDTLAQLRLPLQPLGPRFVKALKASFTDDRLAQTVVDELLVHYLLLNDTELSSLRQAGASNQELIIAMLIASKTRQPARLIYREVKNGSKTWGALLHEAKITPNALQQELWSMLKSQHK